MTDAQLVRLVAEKVMEWRWYRSSSTGERHLLPEPLAPWLVELADGTEPIHAEWSVGLGFEEADTEFNPLADDADTCMVFDKLAQKWYVEWGNDCERGKDFWYCRLMLQTNDHCTLEVNDPDRRRALLLAALKSEGVEVEG